MMRNGMWWVPAPLRRLMGIAQVVVGAFGGALATLTGVAGVDYLANQQAMYRVLMTDAKAAGGVCIALCRNGGLMTFNFGRMIGNVTLDLRWLADFLNGMGKVVYAVFSTSNSSVHNALIVVGVGMVLGAILGPLAMRRQ